jgi:hypothetical protein
MGNIQTSASEAGAGVWSGPPAATILAMPAQDAIAAIGRLHAQLQASRVVVSQAILGPYRMGVACQYDCVLGICWKEARWNAELDLSTRADLQSVIGEVERASDRYHAAIEPARGWLRNTLPQFSVQFSQHTATIRSTAAAIRQAHGRVTPAQAATLDAAFTAILAELKRGQDHMEQAARAVAEFLLAFDAAMRPVTDAGWAPVIDAEVNTMRAQANGLPCGAARANHMITEMVHDFSGAVSQIKSSLRHAELTAIEVNRATGTFVGALGSIVDQYGNVAAQVATAESLPTSIIQDLHLDIAADEWTALSQYATQNIP